MPMYQPSSRRRDGGDGKLDADGGGQVLDLKTAVKDGILGGDGAFFGGGVAEKLDLKKMIAELEPIDVPSVFICPISLELMQDQSLGLERTQEAKNKFLKGLERTWEYGAESRVLGIESRSAILNLRTLGVEGTSNSCGTRVVKESGDDLLSTLLCKS